MSKKWVKFMTDVHIKAGLCMLLHWCDFEVIYASKKWYARRDSNSWPSAPEADALSSWATGAYSRMINIKA